MGDGVSEDESHTGSRAPGQRSLMHPERGWERAPKHSWRDKVQGRDGEQMRHFLYDAHIKQR